MKETMKHRSIKHRRFLRRARRTAIAALASLGISTSAMAVTYDVIPITVEGFDPSNIKKVKIEQVNALGQAVGELELITGDVTKRAIYWDFDQYLAGQGAIEIAFIDGVKETKAKRITNSGLIAGERKGPGTYIEIDDKGKQKIKDIGTAWITFVDQLDQPVIELGGLFSTPNIVEIKPDDVSSDDAPDDEVVIGTGKFLDSAGKLKEFSWVWTVDNPNSVVEILPPASVDKLKAKDINIHGVIVGELETKESGGNPKTKQGFYQLPGGSMQFLPTLAGVTTQETKAERINGDGWIVGEVKTVDAQGKHAVLWRDSGSGYEILDLGTLPDESADGIGREFKAKRINDAGLVLGEWKGEFALPGAGFNLEYDLGFYWTEADGMRNLIEISEIQALVPGADTIKVKPKEFDSTGQLVVGEYEYFLNGETLTAAFLTNIVTGDTQLFSPADFPGLDLDEIKDIRFVSEDGWILINGKNGDIEQALLLVPDDFVPGDPGGGGAAPEPATASLLALGTLALANRRRLPSTVR